MPGHPRQYLAGSLYATALKFRRSPLLQPGLTHEIEIDRARGLAAFGDRPNHERLTAAHVARSEDARHGRHLVLVSFDVAARIEFHSKLIQQAISHRAQETHGQ